MNFISNIIGIPLGWIMWAIYSVFKNYGLAIVIFTLVTKLILFPVSVNQQKSQAAMALFSPKLEKLKKQYAGNQQKLNEEQMKLYSEEGINPMASCLPLVLQLVILYGVFDVIYRPITHILRFSKDVVAQAGDIASKFYGAEKMFNSRPEIYILKAANEHPEAFSGMPDFTAKATEFQNSLFGFIDLGAIPTIKPEVWNAAAIGLIMIPILSGVIQLIMTIYMQIRQKKMGQVNPQGMGAMNIMLYGMPLFSVYLAFNYPAGIGFYWTMSSLFSLFQSMLLYKIYTPEYVKTLVERDKQKRKKKGRPSLSEKYQSYLENQGMASPSLSKSDKSDLIETTGEEKLSKSKQKEMERRIIAEARKRQAEKYGEEYSESDDDE